MEYCEPTSDERRLLRNIVVTIIIVIVGAIVVAAVVAITTAVAITYHKLFSCWHYSSSSIQITKILPIQQSLSLLSVDD